jgi:serine/threonine protein kinase
MAAAPHRILADKYRLIRPLENGGMGSVWLAEHLALASPVAIKLITADVAKTTERLQRFLREARAAAAARSPHVVQILDYGVHEGTPYIVMELLEGESLAERLLRCGHLGPSETEMIIRHVSRAVTRAHEAGIVHRDLKPANIFITHNEEEEIVKVFDFGIAKASEALGGGSGLAGSGLAGGLGKATRTGSFLGTPYYMSPEQLEGGRRSDHRTDIWALGVIAFECLLGRLPFNGQGIGGLVLSVCAHPAPIPSQLGVVPEGFDAWFARACARDLDERFASAREAAASLRAALGGSPGVEPDRGTGIEPDARAPQPSAPDAPAAAGFRSRLGGARRTDAGTVISSTRVGGARIDMPSSPALDHPVTDSRVTSGAAMDGPAESGSRAPLASAELGAPVGARDAGSAALRSTIADPSSATLHPEEKKHPRPLVILAPIVACVAIALALQGFRRSAVATDGVPRNEAATVAVQPLAPAPAGLIVLGEGSDLRVSVDGQDIGAVPCEVEGIAPGDHTVVISADARYRPSHHRVHLEPGAVVTVGPVKLEVAKGLATVVAGEGTEGAELSLSIGDSTLRVPELPVQLEIDTAQPHVLHAERSGFEPYHQRLSFDDGEAEKTFAVSLAPLAKDERAPKKATKAKGRRTSSRRGRPRPMPATQAARTEATGTEATGTEAAPAEAPEVAAPSTFTFTATPQASVLLDGEPLGTTPLYDVPVASGSHRVIFIYGAQRKAMLVVGVSGQNKRVSASFRAPREK